MKKFLLISAILTIGGLTLAGCPKPDAAQDAAGAAKDGAMGAAGAMKDGAMDAKDKMASGVGAAKDGAMGALDKGKISMAIMADESLKDAKIDVEVKDTTVMLKGSVKNNDLKKKAGELATTAAPGATVKNMLLVK